ncbi:substrate-binding domain-containing protein [Saccharopolyspora griseoalba]|uniref:Substrate-binding domain-containing protein n=1 Tax=Saccharopolyspora griseoalba TaxID=1431848 RepID=A0ABW2LSV8_9PSEU
MTESEAAPTFDLAYVPGVTPDKWVRRWNERESEVALALRHTANAEAAGLVREGAVDAALVRLPIDRTGLHAIPLYTERTVVVAPKDHLIAAADEIAPADLDEDVVQHPLDDPLDWDEVDREGPPGLPAIERPATTGDAIQLVAAGVGLLIVPQSVARLHHRKDLTYRPISEAPESTVALTWLVREETPDLMEQFIGVVRGRTVNSTRGKQQEQPAKQKRTSAKQAKPQPAQRGKPRRGGPRPGGRRNPRRR